MSTKTDKPHDGPTLTIYAFDGDILQRTAGAPIFERNVTVPTSIADMEGDEVRFMAVIGYPMMLLMKLAWMDWKKRNPA